MKNIKNSIESEFDGEISSQEHDQNMELKILAQKITELQSQHTGVKKGGGKIVTIEGRKIQHENKA